MVYFFAILLQNLLVSQNGAQSMGHKVWGVEYGDARYGAQSVERKVWDVKCRAQSVGAQSMGRLGAQSMGHKVWEPKSMVVQSGLTPNIIMCLKTNVIKYISYNLYYHVCFIANIIMQMHVSYVQIIFVSLYYRVYLTANIIMCILQL